MVAVEAIREAGTSAAQPTERPGSSELESANALRAADLVVFASGRDTSVIGGSPNENETPAAAETQPAQEVGSPEGTPPAEERVTYTKRELEAEQERRVQAALLKGRKTWERDYAAKQQQFSAEAARQAADAEEAELYRRSAAGEYEADEQLLKRAKSQLEGKYGQQALRAEIAKAQADERQRIWQTHLGAFGVDTEADEPDEELATALQSPDFRTLNAALLKRASAPEMIEAAWQNPGIKARYAAEMGQIQRERDNAVKLARDAGSTNAQIQAIRSGEIARPDLSTSAGGRMVSNDDVERAYAENPRDPEVAKAYRDRILRRPRPA